MDNLGILNTLWSWHVVQHHYYLTTSKVMFHSRLGHGLNIRDVQATVPAFRPRFISLGHELFCTIFNNKMKEWHALVDFFNRLRISRYLFQVFIAWEKRIQCHAFYRATRRSFAADPPSRPGPGSMSTVKSTWFDGPMGKREGVVSR